MIDNLDSIEKGYMHHPMYDGLNQVDIIDADNFYERIKNKDPSILERYASRICPKDLVENLFILFDGETRAKMCAIKRVFYEKQIKDSNTL